MAVAYTSGQNDDQQSPQVNRQSGVCYIDSFNFALFHKQLGVAAGATSTVPPEEGINGELHRQHWWDLGHVTKPYFDRRVRPEW